jgi:hypothetical protein
MHFFLARLTIQGREPNLGCIFPFSILDWEVRLWQFNLAGPKNGISHRFQSKPPYFHVPSPKSLFFMTIQNVNDQIIDSK